MGKWVPESKTIVVSMSNEDFHSHEKHASIDEDVVVRTASVAENETVNVRMEKAFLHSRKGVRCYACKLQGRG